jgi:nucleoside-diphosphate kinase
MIKPDGVQRGLAGEIIKRFEQKGFKLIAMKLTSPGKEHLEKHYADLSSKGFFAGLIEYMTSGPVVAMCWEGKGAVKEGRKMLGATMPSDSAVSVIIVCLYLKRLFFGRTESQLTFPKFP